MSVSALTYKLQPLKEGLRRSPWLLKYHATRRRIRYWRSIAALAIARVFALTGPTSSIYYAIISREFDREHKAVLLGRIAFLRRLKVYGHSNGLLRRNIHRLEKGLIMQPRRPVFALDYIQETLDLYENAVLATRVQKRANNEVIWAYDVLVSYFDVCSGSELSTPARLRFQAMPAPEPAPEKEALPHARKVPYPASERVGAGVSYEGFLQLALRRRSVRWFKDVPVEHSKLDQIIDAARLSPSACNRLPYRFLTLTDPKVAQECARLAGGTTGFANQIPSLIVVLGDLSCYSDERDRHLIYVDASLASMSLMLAAETVGLSTCPINWSDVPSRERAIYNFLKDVPEYWRPVMLIAVGYAEEEGYIPFSSKKDFSIVRSVHNGGV